MARKNKVSSETVQKPFPQLLSEVMDNRGMSRSELQRKVEELSNRSVTMQRQTVSNYLNGQSSPDVERLRWICKALDVSADYLLSLSGVTDPDPDIRKACETTGLSEDAVHVLCLLYGIPGIDALSKLLGSLKLERLINPLFQIEEATQALRDGTQNPDLLKRYSITQTEKMQTETMLWEINRLIEKLDYQRYCATVALREIINDALIGSIEYDALALRKQLEARLLEITSKEDGEHGEH